MEKGGALYIQYTGNNKEDSYAVRVNGGRKIPVLNLYQVNNETERKEKIASYVKELNDYVNALEAEDFKKTEKQLSVYNTTDILIDDMMFSLPASQVLAGLGSENREETLSDTLASMEDVMTLFYQNKGLTNSFAEETGYVDHRKEPSAFPAFKYSLYEDVLRCIYVCGRKSYRN